MALPKYRAVLAVFVTQYMDTLINSISHTVCVYVSDLCLCHIQVSVSSGLLVTVMKQKAKYECICATLFCSTKVLTSFDSAHFRTVSDIWFQ